jgi:hypothetical protein
LNAWYHGSLWKKLPTLYYQEVAGNQTQYQGVRKLIKFSFVISGSAVQIRPWAPEKIKGANPYG